MNVPRSQLDTVATYAVIACNLHEACTQLPIAIAIFYILYTLVCSCILLCTGQPWLQLQLYVHMHRQAKLCFMFTKFCLYRQAMSLGCYVHIYTQLQLQLQPYEFITACYVTSPEDQLYIHSSYLTWQHSVQCSVWLHVSLSQTCL